MGDFSLLTIRLGGKHGHKKFHKKGHHTSGFHHKGHKDESHKEHKFFDSEEKKGGHKKYGSDHEFHESKKGDHKKGEKHDAGYDEGHKGACVQLTRFRSSEITFRWSENQLAIRRR